MKKQLILFSLLVFSITVSAQVNWIRDMKMAKAIATQNDQLILIDFWATWCGPCRVMDKKMWDLPEMQKKSQHFVALKVDIDSNRDLALEYNIRSIPRVVVINVAGDILWDKTGFSSAEPYLKMIDDMPKTLNGISPKLLSKDEFTPTDYYDMGIAFQEIAKEAEGDFATSFYITSDNYLRHVKKGSDNDVLIAKADLNTLLNDAYRGRHKKVLKKTEKIEIPTANDELTDLKSFILAYCFKCEDDETAFLAEKKKVQNEAYLETLEALK